MSGRAWLGLGFLVALVTVVFVALREVPGATTLARRLFDHAIGRMEPLEVRFSSSAAVHLEPGDPVYSIEDQAFALQGRVLDVRPGPEGATVVIHITPGLQRRLTSEARAVAMTPDNDLGWILRTLVPPALREQSLAELRALWEDRRGETLDRLKPHLFAVLGDVANVLVNTLPEVLNRRREEREAFLEVFRSQIYPQELEPALKTEVLTRLERSLGKIGSEIGAEIWAEVSWKDIAGLVWAATKGTFGSDEELVERIGQVLQKRALPVLSRRGPEAVRAAFAAVSEAFDQPAVQQAIDRTAWRTFEDPAFQRFIDGVVDDWILQNPALAARLHEAIRSRAIRGPIEDLYKAAEPLLERSLEEILTRPDRKGMDHQLVRVLRRVVLKKDERYLLIVEGEGASDGTMAVLPGRLGDDP